MTVRLNWSGRDAAEALVSDILAGDSPDSRPFASSGFVLEPWQSPVVPPGHPPCGKKSEGMPPHRLIRADNLDALRWFLQEKERFDLVYIDPPYNTGRGFVYRDRPPSGQCNGVRSDEVNAVICSSSRWLSLLYPRLVLAHRLLSARGLLCVSIDDNEVHHLTTILREIFSAGSHVATIKWKRKRKPSFLKAHVSQVYEYILLFAKDPDSLPRLLGKQSEEVTRPVLNQGNAWVERVIPDGTPASCADIDLPVGRQGVRTLAFDLLDPLVIRDGRVLTRCRVKGPFRVRQEILDKTLYVTAQRGLRRRVLPDERVRQHATDDGSGWSTNEDADAELQGLFGQRVFPFAKPTGMLRQLLRMYPAGDGGPICLDFFAGSGSFAHAVLLENQADGLARRVTLVQSAEPYLGPAQVGFNDIFALMQRRLELASEHLGLRFAEQFTSSELRRV